MRFSPGITAKLFAAFLVTNIVTAVVVGWGVRAAFDTGFEAYVKEREEARLARLAGVLSTAYAESGSWEFLRGNESAWLDLNRMLRRDPSRGPPGEHRGPPPGEFGRGPAPGEPGKGPPRPGFGMGPPGMPPAVVIDESGQVVAGHSVAGSNEELVRHPITSGGKRVGWVAAPLRETAFDYADRRFRDQQWRAGWIVALVAVALSAIVAAFLARGLLFPVKRIAAATRRLADGDYATRVESASGDELGRLVEDFNRLGNALEKHEAARRNFMADVSHELRTPIAVLRGELEAIEDGVRRATPENMASLKAEVARLARLVDDIHDLSLADVGGMSYRFERVDLSRVVTDAIEHNASRIQARALDVQVEVRTPGETLCVRGDAQRLEQLVSNLLENSLRYTDKHGRLGIVLRTEGAMAVLDWSDSEPGVPPEALPRLFERLFRVEASRNRERGGSGLGLAIVKSIVEAHGGTVSARAGAMGGLHIEARLPMGERS